MPETYQITLTEPEMRALITATALLCVHFDGGDKTFSWHTAAAARRAQDKALTALGRVVVTDA